MDNYGGQYQGQNGGQYQGQYPGQFGPQLEKPMSLGDWIITLIVLAIPCVNIIMLFVWGFGAGNTSRKNFCRAQLIMWLIGFVLGILFYAVAGAVFFNALNSISTY